MSHSDMGELEASRSHLSQTVVPHQLEGTVVCPNGTLDTGLDGVE